MSQHKKKVLHLYTVGNQRLIGRMFRTLICLLILSHVRTYQVQGNKMDCRRGAERVRLMGVSEADIDKIQKSGVSKTQQYKMAGNSIVVDVLYHNFRKLFVEKENENEQLTLF